MKKNIKKVKILILVLIFFLITTCTYAHHKKRILFISSYNSSFPTFFKQIEGIKSVLKEDKYVMDIEFMDSKRFFTDGNIDNFYKSLAYKINYQEKYDVIITSDDNAYNFALKYQDEMFKEIPIVFLGVNNVDNALKANDYPYVTGVIERISMKETIESALGINKKANKVIALVDGTTSGQCDLDAFYRLSKEFNNVNFCDLSLMDYTFEEFSKELKKIKKDDIVLLLSFYRDKEGETISYEHGLQMILENTKPPVYHLREAGLGKGFIGGKVISHYEQGKVAGTLVEDILNGKEIRNLPVIAESPNRFIFDYNVLLKHKIDINQIPKGSHFINKEIDFYQKYKTLVWSVAGVFIIMFLLIIGLIESIEKRRKVEGELVLRNDELTGLYEELYASGEEIRSQYEKLDENRREISRSEERLKEIAYYDILTGLANRTYLNKQLEEEIEKAKKSGVGGAIFFIDIDNFKMINDTFGHRFGDKILINIGDKFKDAVGKDQLLARLGGDEFILVLKGIDDKRAVNNLANKIINIFEHPFYIEEKEFYLTLSMGIAFYLRDGDNLDELLKNADTAMYKAKELGKAQYVYFEKYMNEKLLKKVRMQNKLRNAIKNDELMLYYQPQVDLKNHRIVGYEALIRWISPDYGFVPPNEFIHIAEENGFILKLGEWVFEKACEFSKKINEDATNKMMVSINVSPVELMNPDYLSKIKRSIEKTSADPKLIGIEITESALMESFKTNLVTIRKLMDLGIKVSLDDFGTGYSSLNYLRRIPINVLKIDKSFVDHIEDSQKDRFLVKSIIQIAHNLNLEVIAEGVETVGQRKILKEYSCNQIQGYLISKPISEEEVFRSNLNI